MQEIKIAVGQTQAALVQLCDDVRRVFVILVRVEIEQHLVFDHGGRQGCDLLLRLEAIDPVQLLVQGRESGPIDGCLIHAGGIVVANLPRRGRPVRRWNGRAFQDVAEHRPVLILQLGVHAPARLIRRNGIVLEPGAARVGVEVGAGIDPRVHGADIEGGLMLGRRALSRYHDSRHQGPHDHQNRLDNSHPFSSLPSIPEGASPPQ